MSIRGHIAVNGQGTSRGGGDNSARARAQTSSSRDGRDSARAKAQVMLNELVTKFRTLAKAASLEAQNATELLPTLGMIPNISGIGSSP